MLNTLGLILTILLIQTNWLNDSQALIHRIDDEVVLIDATEHKDKDGKTSISNYTKGDLEKLNINYDYKNLIDIKISFYSKDSFLIAQRIVGQDVLIYKRERQADEPYASLIESNIYFQSESFGITKSRRIKVHKSDNIEELKLQLKKQDFIIDSLNNTDYLRLKEKYLRAKTTHNNGSRRHGG